MKITEIVGLLREGKYLQNQRTGTIISCDTRGNFFSYMLGTQRYSGTDHHYELTPGDLLDEYEVYSGPWREV